MDLNEYLEKFDNNYNGNFSIIYDFVKDRLDQYECHELPFREEFIFFENRYVAILKHMRKNNLKAEKIIDIGCELGVQSELFKDNYKYIGIDCINVNFLNLNDKNCKYIVGTFPDVDLEYENSIVISSMSLGYFDWDEEGDIYLSDIVNELSKSKYLYIATNRQLLKLLEEYFYLEYLPCNDRDDVVKCMEDVSNNLYFCTRK